MPPTPPPTTPHFYVTPTHRLSPRSVLAAVILASLALFAVQYALKRTHHGAFAQDAYVSSSSTGDDSDNPDDPNQVDTIYLGGPDQAPTATRPARHPSTVHPFITIRLPRSGTQTGQIPLSPSGHLLYGWLAAFNDKNPEAAAKALPTRSSPAAEAAQVELRKQTGGFSLISAREITPGLLVFRLQDQTPKATEALGTLQLAPDGTLASFSLRAVSSR